MAGESNFHTHTEKIGVFYLIRMKILSFGSLANKVIGPFSPKLNVVFGKNEAGKTSLNAFFGGVLFGWEDARGMRNTYKPKNTERAGSLFFSHIETGEELEVSRAKNSDGLQGDTSFVEDIDKDTYATMFGLTSYELRGLRNTSDVTAKLLTAGSGTNASPAQSLIELQARLAEYTSKAAGIEKSLVNLESRQEELRSQMLEAANEADRLKKQDKEYHEIEPQRENLLKKLQELNFEIENLTAQHAGLEKLDHHLNKSKEAYDSLLEEERTLDAEQLRGSSDKGPNVVVDAVDEYSLREKIDVLLEENNKREHSTERAKENYMTSKAAYDALIEAADLNELEKKAKRQRQAQIFLSVVLPLAFLLIGVPVFLHGRYINSLSFTALGICLVVFGVLLAGAALVMLFRPNKSEEEQEQKRQDAQWVMLQDKKKLEACEKELNDLKVKIEEFLNKEGLGLAQGSLRRARVILDEQKEAQAQSNLYLQKRQALTVQLNNTRESIEDLQEQKAKVFKQLAMAANATLADIDVMISQKIQQRNTLLETSEQTNRRYGELKQELSQAKLLRHFDEIKLEYQQIKTRQKESMYDYARLLLAKRSLEVAIGAWESKSQPEVYKQASRLLSLMTVGKWVQVRMTTEGKLQVVDEAKTAREPLHLSLGTCQQLYLSLRIALLVTAENVGRSIPIMADDILVNFDAERRKGAIKALIELSERRQVILFTSHEEIVSLIRSIDEKTNIIEL